MGLLKSIPRLGDKIRLGKVRLTEIPGWFRASTTFPGVQVLYPVPLRHGRVQGGARTQGGLKRALERLLVERWVRKRWRKRLLDVRELKKYFPIRGGIFSKTLGHVLCRGRGKLHAHEGKAWGWWRERCGKSTTARAILRLIEPTEGEVLFEGRDVCKTQCRGDACDAETHADRLQDPYGSLESEENGGAHHREPLESFRSGRNRRGRNGSLIYSRRFGLSRIHARRYPTNSAAVRDRGIGIRTGPCPQPKTDHRDEPVSALDVSIQAQVINLLEDIPERVQTFLHYHCPIWRC